MLILNRIINMKALSSRSETGIIILFHATGDFTYRNRSQDGVKVVEEVNHFLPRVGRTAVAYMWMDK